MKMTQESLLNPWLSIWVQPRKTIRQIVETDPTRHVILISALTGIYQAFDSVVGIGIESLPLPMIFVIALVIGSFWGVLALYAGGVILHWTSRWFGGQATSEEIRTAYAWSSVPFLWTFIIWVPAWILFGKELYLADTPRLDSSIVLTLLYIGFTMTELVIGIWAYIIFLQCLGEVNHFSAWKALGASLIPGLVVLGPIFICVLSTLLV